MNDSRHREKIKAIKMNRSTVIMLLLMLYDIVALFAAYFLALWIRFDCRYSLIEEAIFSHYLASIPFYALAVIIIFWFMRLYQSIWRFAGPSEILRGLAATALSGTAYIIVMTVFVYQMPVSYYVFGLVLQFIFTIGARFSYRFFLMERGRFESSASADRKNVMVIGAGAAGKMIVREIKNSQEVNDRVCCIVDDQRDTWNRYVDGVPVVGGRDVILLNAVKYNIQKIYLAIPSASSTQKRDLLNICKETGCELKIMPGVYQLMSGEVALRKMKDASVEDLLGRDPVKVNMDEIYRQIEGRVVLITGGGGSIGSELARQVAAHKPKQLIIFDVYENNAYDIQQELQEKYPELNLETLIGSVRDSRTIFGVFERYRPDIVYHAAAHKHVPLMEDSPCEAIKNNTIGTYKTAYAAMVHGCRKFVLISTDKAVNPTNIMGASKRLCEMIIQTFDGMIKAGRAAEIPELYIHSFPENYREKKMMKMPEKVVTEFVAVRFGNVLGSNGSVIPKFKKQIAAGGPVTVTHPDIIRYFMTIPEAVSLVMQAGTYAKGGEIFVLDMGEPVRIADLARNLIQLSGMKPDEDIQIEFTGLRPGEKLYEEKLMAEEGLKTTKNKLIHIGCPIPFDMDEFVGQLRELLEVSYKNDDSIREYVQKVVTTYQPGEE